MRPSYATMVLFLFFPNTALMVLGGAFADGKPLLTLGAYPATIALGPGVVSVITLLFYRHWLPFIWDVNLKIRKLVRLNFDNRSLLRKMYDGIVELCGRR